MARRGQPALSQEWHLIDPSKIRSKDAQPAWRATIAKAIFASVCHSASGRAAATQLSLCWRPIFSHQLPAPRFQRRALLRRGPQTTDAGGESLRRAQEGGIPTKEVRNDIESVLALNDANFTHFHRVEIYTLNTCGIDLPQYGG